MEWKTLRVALQQVQKELQTSSPVSYSERMYKTRRRSGASSSRSTATCCSISNDGEDDHHDEEEEDIPNFKDEPELYYDVEWNKGPLGVVLHQQGNSSKIVVSSKSTPNVNTSASNWEYMEKEDELSALDGQSILGCSMSSLEKQMKCPLILTFKKIHEKDWMYSERTKEEEILKQESVQTELVLLLTETMARLDAVEEQTRMEWTFMP